MPDIVFWILYLPLLLIVAGIALSKWKILSTADRWMAALLLVTVAQECLSRFLASNGNNFRSYHIYTPIELFFISMYFDRSIAFRHAYRLGGIIAVVGFILAFVNVLYFQPFDRFNSYFLMFEACVILSFCMLSFYRLLIRDDVVPGKMTQFWLTLCFLFYSSLTFVIYGLYGAMIGHKSSLSNIFGFTLFFANFSLYFGIGIVFSRYKKMIPSGE
jgi:hypothetical protein